MTQSESGSIELAHVMPGRMRLRWRGAVPPPIELLSSIEAAPEVRRVEYRPTTRSLVLTHGDGFHLDELRARAATLQIGLREPAAPSEAPEATPARSAAPARKELIVADLEALLLVGLMVTWARDLVVSRTLRAGPILLILLTGVNLYEFWRRRQQAAPAPNEPPDGQLELITG